jgi:hypothetical protein
MTLSVEQQCIAESQAVYGVYGMALMQADQ